MKGLRLYKIEKLCSEIAIGSLFSHGNPDNRQALAYPLRVVWRVNGARRGSVCPKFLVSVPKKRLRHAVDRVRVRRCVREAYRLSRDIIPADVPLEMVFVYVASEVLPSSRITPALRRLLHLIAESQEAGIAVESTTETAPE